MQRSAKGTPVIANTRREYRQPSLKTKGKRPKEIGTSIQEPYVMLPKKKENNLDPRPQQKKK
jgi:hypothetical protein